MFEDIPRTFDTIIARDSWLWNHIDAPLLSSSDQDRLLSLPNDETKNPFGYEWAKYGCAGYSGHPFSKTAFERPSRRSQTGSF